MHSLLNNETTKRLFDFILAFILFIIFLPVSLAVSIFIGITSGRPFIYEQRRIGKNSKPFTLYKFRTMLEYEIGPLWTEEDDERISFGGNILRKTHLDEIPQLINILRGEISFVGPRPERSELVELYKQLPDYEMRHTIKPGLTGWAQLNYKASTSIEEANEKLRYDIYYIKNRSLILDIIILSRTIKHLFFSFL